MMNFDVFRASVKDRVFGEFQSRLVVTGNSNRKIVRPEGGTGVMQGEGALRGRVAEFAQKASHPNGFKSPGGEANILGFS
jgi:hypothetical protein